MSTTASTKSRPINRQDRSDGDDEFKHELLAALAEIRDGNFEVRVTSGKSGVDARLAETLNQISGRMERFNTNLVRLRHQVGEEGRISERMALGDSIGSW